jgi:hypothetical protein
MVGHVAKMEKLGMHAESCEETYWENILLEILRKGDKGRATAQKLSRRPGSDPRSVIWDLW